jgi:8-oxo-dGTP diphosphatase
MENLTEQKKAFTEREGTKNLGYLLENRYTAGTAMLATKELNALIEDSRRPKIGVGVAIFNGESLLLHKRLGKHSPGVWAFPGGHLEFGETFSECALREVREECGDQLRITVPKFWTAVNTVYPEEDRHYVVIFMYAVAKWRTALTMEPDKGEDWKWFHVDHLPDPLMQGIQTLKDAGLLRSDKMPQSFCP